MTENLNNGNNRNEEIVHLLPINFGSFFILSSFPEVEGMQILVQLHPCNRRLPKKEMKEYFSPGGKKFFV